MIHVKMLKGFLSGFYLVVILQSSKVTAQNYVIDICAVDRVYLHNEGETGTVLFDYSEKERDSPCVLRLQSPPDCYMSIKPSNTFLFSGCNRQPAGPLCTPGCSYAYLFDGFYYNETVKYITDSSWTSYNTSSSVLYVAVCHTPNTNLHMELQYTTVERRYEIVGDSSRDRTGHVTSTYFPNYYLKNGEQMRFQIRSRLSTDKVVLFFDDFDIAPGGALYFDPSKDFQVPLVITEDTKRPIVVSDGNELQIMFDTGWGNTDSYRDYLGFNTTYRFISAYENFVTPIANCGSYYMTLNGGNIEFKPIRFDVPFDCVWVVKTQPGYKATYIKVNRFSSDYGVNMYVGTVKVEVRAGLTSSGKLVGTLYPSNTSPFDGFTHTDGFYIRLQGTVRNALTFKLAFTSFTNYYTSGCNLNTHFRCSSGQCIPNKLACDHVDHCDDGTDETFGCSASDVNNGPSQQTLTISVIIPVVVSIFLLIVLCILFVLIRRCLQARQLNDMSSTGPSVCTRDRRGRRRGHDDHFRRPPDAPPTYDEALVTGIPVPDNGYLDDPYEPKPPPYTETCSSPLMGESSQPLPPYFSREDLRQENEAFLDARTGPTNEGPVTSTTNDNQETVSTSTQTNGQYKKVHKRSKDHPSLHLQNTGRLPNLPSVGSQSMQNLSRTGGISSMQNISGLGPSAGGTQCLHNVSEGNKLLRARSEQILSPKDLSLGVINQAFVDDQGQLSNRHSRLYRGQAVSNLELPIGDKNNSSESVKPETEQNLEFSKSSHHSDQRYEKQCDLSESLQNRLNEKLQTNSNKKGLSNEQSQKQSARDRLKPKDPNLSKKYDEELLKRENSRQKTSRKSNTSGNNITNSGMTGTMNSQTSSGQAPTFNVYNPYDRVRTPSANSYRKPESGTSQDCATSNRKPESGTSQDCATSNRKPESGTSQDYLTRTKQDVGKQVLNDRKDRNYHKIQDSHTPRSNVHRSDHRNAKYRTEGLHHQDNVVRGSTLSLDLGAGHRSRLHRSTMSLNENLISRESEQVIANSGEPAPRAGNMAATFLDGIGEDVFV